MPPEVCPNCGAEVPPRARACPQCGSDDQTGWSERAQSDNLGLPDEDFDYDDYVKREFGPPNPVPSGIHWLWWLVAAMLVILFALAWLRR